MTPMIDVVFQLLIFFICTASFQRAEELLPMGLAVNGGTVAAISQNVEPESSRVVVKATRSAGQTRWVVNDSRMDSLRDVEYALRALASRDRSTLVTLDVASAVPLGHMIDVYDLCRLAGLKRIEFAVEQRR
jgi:biopolymer transport protein ExbD